MLFNVLLKYFQSRTNFNMIRQTIPQYATLRLILLFRKELLETKMCKSLLVLVEYGIEYGNVEY